MIIDGGEDQAGAIIQAQILEQAREYLEMCLVLCVVGSLDREEAMERIMDSVATFPGWDEEVNPEIHELIRKWLHAAKDCIDSEMFASSVMGDLAELPDYKE